MSVGQCGSVERRGRRVVSRFHWMVADYEARLCGGWVVPEIIDGTQYYSVYAPEGHVVVERV